MDLTADQSNRIKQFLKDWVTDPRLELETTFGARGVVDSTTFLQIAQRLRAKGFHSRAQEDRLNILLPNHMRFTLEGLGVLQAYCKDDSLDKKTFTAMIKDRAFPQSNLDVDEYAVRFKIRREEELSAEDPRIKAVLKQWSRQRKAFRLIRRWSFEGKGVRMDLSMVRQTASVPGKSEFQWSTTFLEKNILQEMPRYEVEVELLRTDATATQELALKALISGVGEVLRAIQKNTLLIRASVTQAVRDEYQELVGGAKFRGVGPVTLETRNISRDAIANIPNIRTSYNVTDKADGLRSHGFVNDQGELYLVDQSLNLYRTGLVNKACRKSLVDGEWVTATKDHQPIHHFLLFDIYYAPDGEKVSSLPFATFKEDVIDPSEASRYRALNEWFTTWSKDVSVVAKGVTDANRLVIAIKTFYFAPPGPSIFSRGCASILDTPRLYHTDGLILTSNDKPLPDGLGVRFEHQFKWKPAKENTVDFLVSMEKDTEFPTLDRIQTTQHPVTKEFIQYKTMRLYVGGKKAREEANPRETILYQRIDSANVGKERAASYRPVLFHPINFPDTMANQCHAPIQTDPETYEEYVLTEDSKEPIQHHSIVEMRYDPTREVGWRWIPSRIRHDKTERLHRAIAASQGPDGKGAIKYSGMMNDEGVANSVWSSIHDPVTESMIRSGSDHPTQEEWKAMMPSFEEKEEIGAEAGTGAGAGGERKYYERKSPQESMALIRGLQDFHNKYIKNEILLKRALVGFNKSVLDLACGKAGDLYKWVTNNAGRVVGVDTAPDNITNPVDGAYRRFMDVLKEGYFRKPPKMAFVIGDSSKSIVDGSAASTPEDRDILRSIFGRAEPEGAVPPYIKEHFASTFRQGADVAACMFALHYFFESKAMLDGLLDNLEQTVKIGGYFIGCCFDGQKVFDLLRGVERGHSKTGMENDVPIWSITKEYEADHLEESEASIGFPIDVNFISIGMTHREFLVPFDYLKQRLRAIGFRLLNPEELAQLQLQQSTNTFDQSYRMAQDFDDGRGRGKGPSADGHRFFMPESVKTFSFLNRWFLFKRAGLSEAEIAIPAVGVGVGVGADAVPEAEAVVNRRFGPELTRYNRTYGLYSIVDASEYSVLKPWEKRDVNGALLKWFSPVEKVRRIVDATAHIGVDTINFSNVFPNAVIEAYEIVPETYEALVKNIVRFRKQQKIHPHNEDITLWEPSFTVDFLYVDPPWGGRNYSKQDSVDLFLQKEGNEHNEAKNVNALIDKWIASGKIRNIVMKAPKNFNKDYLKDKYGFEEATVQGRKGIAYTLLHIKPRDIVVDEVELEEVEEQGDEKKQEEKEEKSALALFRDPTHVFKEKDILLFGPSVALRDSLKTKGRPSLKLTIKLDHVGRWLGFSAPFPLPDPDEKDQDGQTILYPTMEHYLAAMKYRHASNRPDLAIQLFSTKGTIHQRTQKTRLEKRTTAGSGTPQDDTLLEKEWKEVRDTMSKVFTDKYRIIFNEEKWKRPLRPDDPLSMRDRILRDALAYRWEKDDNFRKIVEEARAQGRYLLYTLGSDSDASEWAGRLEVSGPEAGRIRGENRVGFFLMEIAGFT